MDEYIGVEGVVDGTKGQRQERGINQLHQRIDLEKGRWNNNGGGFIRGKIGCMSLKAKFVSNLKLIDNM